jgi:hypothetical protein
LDKGNVLLHPGSIHDYNIPPNSVDIIITDPPYGSNVQYLELSHFWHPWNRDLYQDVEIDFSKEAVSNRKKNFEGSKDLKDYEDNLFNVFSKCHEVLKENGLMIMTFNNKDIGAWLALLISIFRAGFHFEESGLFFQSGVKNYKHTAHTKYKGSPYGDFIYVFRKNSNKVKCQLKKKISEDEFIERIDNILLKHITPDNLEKNDGNKLIKNMMIELIPEVESFAQLNIKEGRHSIYEKYRTNHLEKIYSGKYGKNK